MGLLGLAEEPFDKQQEALRTIPVEELVEKTFQVVPALPAVDRIFLPKAHGIFCVSDPEDLSIPGKTWCKAMILGDSKDDVSFDTKALQPRFGKSGLKLNSTRVLLWAWGC